MTCIVGLAHGGKVYLGADSAGLAGDELTPRRDPKVFRVGEFVFGYTTSFRMGQVLRYGFTPPTQPEGMIAHEYLCTHVVDALRQAFQRAGCATVNSGVETCGNFLIGYRGHASPRDEPEGEEE
jgi:hypothetical protein